MATVKFKTRFNTKPREYAFTPTGDSLTQQQFKEECDVNNILAKYKKTGMLNHLNKHQANYGDFSDLNDYQTNLDKVMHAQNTFNELPSNIRSKFENDPGKLIDFLSKEENNEEAIKLGLKFPRKKPEPSIQQQMENALENHSKKTTKKDEK